MPENSSKSNKARSQDRSGEDVSLKEITAPQYRATKIDSLKKRMSSKISNRGRVFNFYKSKMKNKLNMVGNKVKNVLIPREIYYKGQEPPKSYAFKKEFIGIYLLFILYSLILIVSVNVPNEQFINFFTLGRPFEFGSSIMALFLTLSFILSNNKIRYWIFENNKLYITYLKQIVIFSLVFFGLFMLFTFFLIPYYNITSYLLLFSMLWLFLLSSRFYSYSRRFSTNIEARFISKYSKSRSMIASITPIIIIGFLVIFSLVYRTFLVVLALDIFGTSDPSGAISVYQIEMRMIMPLIYLSLILTFIFIIFEYIFTRRVAETKRAGKFDNFTFSMIVFFIFFFQLMQVSLFLFTRPETVGIVQDALGTTTGSTISAFFLIEFIITMIFLFRILVKTGKTFGWRILWFKKDGVVLLILTCVFAQTITQYARIYPTANQDVTHIGNILDLSKFLVSILMIVFLGLTLIIYYLRPHETSVFMRMMKETVKQEEKESEQIYGIIRNEYIRRGDAFDLKGIEREIMKSTKLPIDKLYETIDHLGETHFDIHITKKKDKNGKVISRTVDFISITETFERKDLAQKKAKKYLSDRLFDTMAEEKKDLKLSKELDTEKASDMFLSSLSADYSKKVKSKKQSEIKQRKAQRLLAKRRDLSEENKQVLFEILKKEYVYRIENPNSYPEIYYPISKVAYEIQKNIKINIGEVYPYIEDLSKSDIELVLLDNPEDPDDKKIGFFPIADDSMCFALSHFRPDEYKEMREQVRQQYNENLSIRRNLSLLKNIIKDIAGTNDQQKKWMEILTYFERNYNTYKKRYISLPSKKRFHELIESFPKNEKLDVIQLANKKKEKEKK